MILIYIISYFSVDNLYLLCYIIGILMEVLMYKVIISLPKGQRKSKAVKFVEDTVFTVYDNAFQVAKRWKAAYPNSTVFVITSVL